MRARLKSEWLGNPKKVVKDALPLGVEDHDTSAAQRVSQMEERACFPCSSSVFVIAALPQDGIAKSTVIVVHVHRRSLKRAAQSHEHRWMEESTQMSSTLQENVKSS